MRGGVQFGVAATMAMLVVLVVSVVASVDNRVGVPVRDRREQSLSLFNSLLNVKTCGVSCADPQYCCEAGYFCIRNALCLRGSPSDYEDAAFIGVGVILGIIASAEHISLSATCVNDVFDSVDAALRTFEDWDNGNRGEAMTDLRGLFGDLEKTWNACRSSGNEPWWEKLINVAAKIVSDFFPEVKAVATGVEIILHGENLYNDYQRMHQYCLAAQLRAQSATPAPIGESYSDLVNCGIGIGDFGYEVYEILTDDDEDDDKMEEVIVEMDVLIPADPTQVTMTVYSDNHCTTATGSVSAPLHQCIPIPMCPMPSCQDAVKCVLPDTTLSKFLTCLGCKSASPITLSFSAYGTYVTDSIYYEDSACNNSPVRSSNTTVGNCVSLSSDHGCGTSGSAKITLS